MNKKRLFIVANRLPVQVTGEKDQARIHPVSGGLVSAINSYLQQADNAFGDVFWAGVPGCTPTTWQEAAHHLAEKSFTYLPVLVYKEQYENYYNGFSNCTLWPLFHYFPSYAAYDAAAYEDYLQVNEHFAEVLVKHIRPGDTVWIHDYHLLPLAGILRRLVPQLTIGFFLHIPFPSYEVFRLIPRQWQTELLNGMLGADLVGFHTVDYAAHFLDCVQKILGLENDRNTLRFGDRLVNVGVFPISVDDALFHQGYDRPDVAAIRQQLKEKFQNQQIIFSVDRLDYTKGVRNRVNAYERFLQQHPEYREKVVFVINIIPSRDTIDKYTERKKMIDEAITRINSETGTLHWQPIIYRYSSMPFNEMLALYTACDLALITPLRDGMNLVAKEFVASRKDKRGVLVISEMAGAAKELNGALVINPNDVQEMADKIREGLEMDEAAQEEAMATMQQRISGYNVKDWAEDFVSSLYAAKAKQQTFQELFLDEGAKRTLLDRFRRAKKRLLLLDYDGTLVPFSSHPDAAVPDANLRNLLDELARKDQTDVYIISGRSGAWLEQHLKGIPVRLVAEHGAMFRSRQGHWQSEAPLAQEWREKIRHTMDAFVRRCPHSFVEEKRFSMVWHYRNADVSQGRWNAHALVGELNDLLGAGDLHVMAGNKIVEVKRKGVDKGSAVKRIISRHAYDFVFAAGDDKTDEDMFKALLDREHAYTIKVGPKASFARYNLMRPQMVVALLESMNHLPLLQKSMV